MSTETSSEQAPEKNAARTGFNAVLAVVLTLGAIIWALDIPREFGLLFYNEQFHSATLAVAIALVFLSIRWRGTSDRSPLPWYDIVIAIVGFGAAFYTAFRYPVLAELVAARPIDGLISGSIMMFLVIEGLRRAVGNVLMVVVVGFLIMGLLGHLLPGMLEGREMEWQTLFYYLSWDPTGILGVPMRVVTTIVIAFVFFGQVLVKSGGSQFFTEVSMALVGRYRGGQAKIAVTASGFFGSISGSVVSNVVTTGVITIPLMRSGGYRAMQAGAIEAVASTGGQLMPPVMGAAAFLMAEFLEIPYSEIVLAALIPAILYYVALFVLADLEAARTGITPLKEEDIPKLWPILKKGWHFPLPFIALIYALFWLNWSPEMSALLGAGVIMLAGAVFGNSGRRFTLLNVYESIRDTGFAVLDIILIGAAAGVIIGTLNVTGIGFGMSLAMVELGQDSVLVLLIISGFICILLGMGMPTVAVYLMLATLIAPSLIEVGVNQIAAHLFILYFGMMSMITPPVAIAAFAAASLTGEDAMKTGFTAMRFGWFAYLVPFLFIYEPALLMVGDISLIVLTTAKVVLGILLVSFGMMGYMKQKLGVIARVLFVLAGIILMLPDKTFPDIGTPVWALGLILGAALSIFEIFKSRRLEISASS